MPRLRPLRRRAHPPLEDNLPSADDETNDFMPFVPVEAERPYDDEEMSVEPSRRRLRRPRPQLRTPRPHLPRLQLPQFEIDLGLLILVILLVAGGIFGTLLNQGRIRDDVEQWWPAGVIGGAIIWLLAALARRRVAAFLGAAAALGVGLSLLMDTQDIASLQDTMLGLVLVAIGLGIVIRGFLLRQQNVL